MCTASCGFDEHTCGDGTCVDISFICNGKEECTDGSDELDCGGSPFIAATIL